MEMDFPEKSFPYQLSSRKRKKRALFDGFGSLGNLDVADIESQTFMTQRVPSGFLSNDPNFCASHPTLPLCSEPVKVSYPFRDRVMEKLRIKERTAREFVASMISYRNAAQQTQRKEFRQSLDDVVKELDKIEKEGGSKRNMVRLVQKTPPWMDKLTEKYNIIKDMPYVPKMNSAYIGGCLTILPSEVSPDKKYIISPSGPHFKELKFTETCENPDGKLDITNSVSHSCGYEIYEVTSETVMDEGLVLVRGESMCELLRLDTNNETSQNAQHVSVATVHKESFKNDVPSSVCLSSFIPCECVIATHTGNVHLWSADGRKEVAITEKSHRFLSHETWRQAVFGAHPRHIIVADNTVVEMFDMRRNLTCSGIDLFALPSKFLNQKERVRVINQTPISPHTFTIATDHSLVMVDERFPGTPILQWSHPLTTSPQYISSVAEVGGSNHILLSVAGHSPSDVLCYLYDHRDSNPPQALGSPWKISQIDDFTKWSEICSGPSAILTQERFDTSLTGIMVLNGNDGFCCMQVDSQGDIFYQQYKSTNEKRDKTFATGPGSRGLKLDDMAIDIGRTWIRNLHQFVSEVKQENKNKRILHRHSKSSLFEEIVLQTPHVSCALCVANTNEGKSYDNVTDESRQCTSDARSDEECCHNCLQTLQTGRQLLLSESEQNACCSLKTEDPLNHTADLEPIENLPQTDALSQILLRQWDDNFDVADLLEKRDEKIKAKKREKQKERLSAKASRDLMSSGINSEMDTVIRALEDGTLQSDHQEKHVVFSDQFSVKRSVHSELLVNGQTGHFQDTGIYSKTFDPVSGIKEFENLDDSSYQTSQIGETGDRGHSEAQSGLTSESGYCLFQLSASAKDKSSLPWKPGEERHSSIKRKETIKDSFICDTIVNSCESDSGNQYHDSPTIHNSLPIPKTPRSPFKRKRRISGSSHSSLSSVLSFCDGFRTTPNAKIKSETKSLMKENRDMNSDTESRASHISMENEFSSLNANDFSMFTSNFSSQKSITPQKDGNSHFS